MFMKPMAKPVKPVRSQKGAGQCSSRNMVEDVESACLDRIRALKNMVASMEIVFDIVSTALTPEARNHYSSSIAMLKDENTLKIIAENDELYEYYLRQKEIVMEMLNTIWRVSLQEQPENSDLFTNVLPSNISQKVSYKIITAEDTECDKCPITLEDIKPNEGIKITHTIGENTFFVCLSNKIFDEEPIRKAMEAGKKWMKHPILRDKAYIDLSYVKSLLEGSALPFVGGTMHYKRTDKKITLFGRERTIYLGKHNKQFVQLNRQYVTVSSLTSHKKASK